MAERIPEQCLILFFRKDKPSTRPWPVTVDTIDIRRDHWTDLAISARSVFIFQPASSANLQSGQSHPRGGGTSSSSSPPLYNNDFLTATTIKPNDNIIIICPVKVEPANKHCCGWWRDEPLLLSIQKIWRARDGEPAHKKRFTTSGGRADRIPMTIILQLYSSTMPTTIASVCIFGQYKITVSRR